MHGACTHSNEHNGEDNSECLYPFERDKWLDDDVLKEGFAVANIQKENKDSAKQNSVSIHGEEADIPHGEQSMDKRNIH